MSKCQVTVPYIGRILSKNYYKFPNGGTRPAAKRWADRLSDKIRALPIPTASSYRVGIRGHFADERRPDIQNLFDLISDAVQAGLGVNDKYFIMADDGCETSYPEPVLVITIEELK